MSGALLLWYISCPPLSLTCPAPSRRAAANLGDGSGPLGKLVRVLNNQLNALMQLEAQTDELSGKLASLQTSSNGLH